MIIAPANAKKIDTNIILKLPDKGKVFITTKFRGEKYKEWTKRQKECGLKY